MADQAAEEQLLDVSVAEASAAYKFYLNNEKKILGTSSVIIFLTAWELVGNILGLINPMFMSAPSLVFKAAVGMFSSGEIYNDLYVSGLEFGWGYLLSVVVGVPFGIACGWYKKIRLHIRPLYQCHERDASRCVVALSHHLAWDRHLVQGRNHLSWRRISDLDQCARRRKNHPIQPLDCRKELRRFRMADF